MPIPYNYLYNRNVNYNFLSSEGDPNDYNYNAEWPDFEYPADYVIVPSVTLDRLIPGKRYYANKNVHSVLDLDIHKIIFNSYEGPVYEPGYVPKHSPNINRKLPSVSQNATFIVNYTDVVTMEQKQGVVKYDELGITTNDSLVFHQIDPVEEEKIRQKTIQNVLKRVPENIEMHEIRKYLGKNGGRRLTKRSKQSKRTKRTKRTKRSKSHRRR